MAVSQFKLYMSADPQGPGPMTGITGSLITILDACLVNGYGTGSYYKAPAGWSKPYANSGSAEKGVDVYACYTQGGGASCSYFVNDSGPVTAGVAGKEAWLTGWVSMSAITGPQPSGSTVGYGRSQFPYPNQWAAEPQGYVAVRKSNTADTTPRNWLVAADATTCYVFIQSGDATLCYTNVGFGDIYSYSGTNDKWRAMIYGRAQVNSGLANNQNNATFYDCCDVMPLGANYGYDSFQHSLPQPGFYMLSNANGTSQPIMVNKRGNSGVTVYGYQWSTSSGGGANSTAIGGMLGVPHDGQYWLCPLRVLEPQTYPIQRGQLRGLWQVCHYFSLFGDGQIISGSANYPGRTWMIIRPSISTVGFWALEISNTVETN